MYTFVNFLRVPRDLGLVQRFGIQWGGYPTMKLGLCVYQVIWYVQKSVVRAVKLVLTVISMPNVSSTMQDGCAMKKCCREKCHSDLKHQQTYKFTSHEPFKILNLK
jgi:hypothetical protein